MPQILAGLVVKIGTRHSDAKTSPVALDDPNPLVTWDLPAGFSQHRYSVRIQNAETSPDGWAFAQSGPVNSTDRHWQFPETVNMNQNFAGLNKVEVSVSANDSGDFEYVSNPLYYVYDQRLERFYFAEQVSTSWRRPNDPDNRPVGPVRHYELQISTDPTFATTSYDAELDATPDQIGQYASRVVWDVPNGQFNPAEQTTYFYRVRAFDQLEWGDWSKVNAFRNYNHLPPTFKFRSVTPLNNGDGDVLITYEVKDDSPQFSAEIDFTGGDVTTPLPISTVESDIATPPGVRAVTWRSRRQLGAKKVSVVLRGHAFDGELFSPDDTYGPTEIDNSALNSGGNLGSIFWVFNVTGRTAITRQRSDLTFDSPVTARLSIRERLSLDQMAPVRAGRYLWQQVYQLGGLENYALEDLPWQQGVGHNAVPTDRFDYLPSLLAEPKSGEHSVFWQAPFAFFNVFSGPEWSKMGSFLPEVKRFNESATPRSFLFRSPVDNSRADTLSVSFSSPDMPRNQCLVGWRNPDGTVGTYPNEYDWDRRPAAHIGNEVWADGDAWVQVMYRGRTDKHACATCQGRNWVAGPAGGGKFTRFPCPNPHCLEGFDLTLPIFTLIGQPPAQRTVYKTSIFKDIKWYRLNTLLTGTIRPRDDQLAKNVRISTPLFRTQHIVGRHLSTVDGVYDSANPPNLLRYVETVNGHTRTLPKETSAPHAVKTWNYDGQTSSDVGVDGDPSVHSVTRQDDGPRLITALMHRQDTTSDLTEIAPVAGGRSKKKSAHKDGPGAVDGDVGVLSRKFRMYGVDPDSNPVHAARRRPTQPGTVRVTGRLERYWRTRELDFRFLPAWWDAFMTVQFAQTGSAGSRVQVQYAVVNPDGTLAEFRDLPGSVGEYDAHFGAYLIEPLTFHDYLSTHDPLTFVEGQRFKLRLRTVARHPSVISEWVYSDAIQILHEVPNPVSVVSMEYDSFTHIVNLTIRLDDSQADAYNLVRFWYSSDDGYTWFEIGVGDIYGDTLGLEAGSSEDGVTHALQWDTRNYGLKPGDVYRVKIEVIPTGLLETAVLPYFKWSAPLNPTLDQAETTLSDIMGRVETMTYNETAKRWEQLPSPRANPGQMFFLQRELAAIRAIPPPSGILQFVIPSDFSVPPPSGSLIDPSGYIPLSNIDAYSAWKDTPYNGSETRGQAMGRVGAEIDRLANVVIPNAEDDVLAEQKAIRLGLIRQGYYPEQYYLGTAPNWRESIIVPVVVARDDTPVSDTVEREWKWKVQGTASGGTDLFDADGVFRPTAITPLERAYFRLQLDGSPTFDSQPGGLPLRDFIFNANGERIAAAGFYGGRAVQDYPPNPAAAAAEASQTAPGQGQPSDLDGMNQFADISESPDQSVSVFGGTLKVKPVDLPGEHEGDVLPPATPAWDGTYYWRFAAYNAITAPNSAMPRPLVVSANLNTALNQIEVNYDLQAHENLTAADVSGYQVSAAFLPQSQWVDLKPINFASDRYAPDSDPGHSNTLPLVGKTLVKTAPCVVFDDEKKTYHVFYSRRNVSNQFRIAHAMGMSLDMVSEFDMYQFPTLKSFGNFRPFVVRGADRWYMFFSAGLGLALSVRVSESTDLENWSNPVTVAGILTGANPTVVYKDGYFHLWYERLHSGVVKVFKAIGTTASSMTMENSGLPVYTSGFDLNTPSVVWSNGVYILYYADIGNTGQIKSVYSANGITGWTGLRTEMGSSTISFNGTPTTVTPSTVFVFRDRYGGNDEWVMAFNFGVTNGNLPYVARLEDRAWQSVPNKINGTAGNLTNVVSSPDGVGHTVYIDAIAHGVTPASNVKVRLFFGNVQPATMEYRRQSKWVDASDYLSLDAYMDPPLYSYNSLLPLFPYMET